MLERPEGYRENGGSAESVGSTGATDTRMRALLAALAADDRDLGARVVTRAMAANDLAGVPALASAFASHTRAAIEPAGSIRLPYPEGISPALSAAKVRHDLRQLEWLERSGKRVREQAEAIDLLRRALSAFDDLPADARLAWESEAGRMALRAMTRVYRVRQSPRPPCALSSSWSRSGVVDAYRRSRAGIVVVDDFLAPAVLSELRRFCLESTIWTGNRYPDGRLSSLLLNGFASPLLFQIAAELRDALRPVIGGHPLRQVWGFKYTQSLPADSTVHADSAAINVNFWITPDAANRDPGTGGMTVYELEAPAEWGFAAYNRDIEAIRRYLAFRQPRAIHVPYRGNRAVIFNSNLFHETDAVDFDGAYENHRVNVTLLYGDRVDAQGPGQPSAQPVAAWRSGAFRRR